MRSRTIRLDTTAEGPAMSDLGDVGCFSFFGNKT